MNMWFCLGCGKGVKPKDNYCGACHKFISKWAKNHPASLVPAVKTGKNFPTAGFVSQKRLDEMDRRVPIIDHSKRDGYRVGRLMENGKISDKNYDDRIRE